MPSLPGRFKNGSVLAIVVGAFGLLATAGGTLLNVFTTALSPTTATELAEQHLLFSPVVQIVGTAGAALCYAALIFGSVLVLSRRPLGPRVVRIACITILAQSAAFVALSLPIALHPSGVLAMTPAMQRAALIAAGVMWVVMLLVYGTIFFLMRPVEKAEIAPGEPELPSAINGRSRVPIRRISVALGVASVALATGLLIEFWPSIELVVGRYFQSASPIQPISVPEASPADDCESYVTACREADQSAALYAAAEQGSEESVGLVRDLSAKLKIVSDRAREFSPACQKRCLAVVDVARITRMTSPPPAPISFGMLRVDRVTSSYGIGTVVITYENTTPQTFSRVTVECTAEDGKGATVARGDHTFYGFSEGPIRPGFKRTKDVIILLHGAQLSRARCELTSGE
ncbi:MAG: hypothetical protein HY271_04890 [Deltaproteobacteria bacterium]|nr:hypothetical protein [Deltaproteobacteria bacterium]